jgi:hypothetical protein
MDIPFPFGIGPGCFRDGFEVLCNQSRAFFSDTGRTATQQNSNALSLLELASVSVGTGEARAYAPVSSVCSSPPNTTVLAEQHMYLETSPFFLSETGNVLIGLGQSAQHTLIFTSSPESMFVCHTYDSQEIATRDGLCTAGCCEAPVDRFSTLMHWSTAFFVDNYMSIDMPCSYAMLVEKSWYSYTRRDLDGKTLLKKFPRGVPVLLDFAAGETWCPAEGEPRPPGYACVHGNSSCANAIRRTPGYICKCLQYYAGNPYVPNGCQGKYYILLLHIRT